MGRISELRRRATHRAGWVIKSDIQAMKQPLTTQGHFVAAELTEGDIARPLALPILDAPPGRRFTCTGSSYRGDLEEAFPNPSIQHQRLPKLTLTSLDKWAGAAGQKPQERAQRQQLVVDITKVSWRGKRQLTVPSTLDLCGCTSLTSLPEGLQIREHLWLKGCTALTKLPRGLRVGGLLVASRCTSLAELPERLTVGWDLILGGCTSLTELPEGLTVGNCLDLCDCTSLTRLPDRLTVGEDLYLAGCTMLTRLPQALLRWPSCSGGVQHRIDITGSGIPPNVIENMQAMAGGGVQVVFGVGPEDEALESFIDLATAWAFWRPLAAVLQDDGTVPTIDALVTTSHEMRNLLVFLHRLLHTADYRNTHSRPLLAARVVSLLRCLATSSEFAVQCHELIGEALESCGDRISLTMNQLDIALRVHHAQADKAPQDALRSLGCALVRLEEVHRHAAAKVATLQIVDPIEVYLAYETALAQSLGLPVFTLGMLYHFLSDVTAKDISAARKAAMAAGQDVQRVEAFLLAWKPWQNYLRREAARHCTWERLVYAPASTHLANNLRCSLTLETLADMRASGQKPIVVAGASGNWDIFAFEPLMTWWENNGTHPVHRTPLRLENIRRPACGREGIRAN